MTRAKVDACSRRLLPTRAEAMSFAESLRLSVSRQMLPECPPSPAGLFGFFTGGSKNLFMMLCYDSLLGAAEASTCQLQHFTTKSSATQAPAALRGALWNERQIQCMEMKKLCSVRARRGLDGLRKVVEGINAVRAAMCRRLEIRNPAAFPSITALCSTL